MDVPKPLRNFSESLMTVGAPCKPAVVEAGSYLPAVPMNALYASVAWGYAPAGFSVSYIMFNASWRID